MASHRFELPPGPKKTALYESVLLRAGYRCENVLCRKRPVEVDHHVPRSQGGPDTFANLCALCTECHRLKESQVLIILANGDGTFRWHDLRRSVTCEACSKKIDAGTVVSVPTPTGGRRWVTVY